MKKQDNVPIAKFWLHSHVTDYHLYRGHFMCGRMSGLSFLFLASQQLLQYNGPPFSSPGAGYVISPLPGTWTPLYYIESFLALLFRFISFLTSGILYTFLRLCLGLSVIYFHQTSHLDGTERDNINQAAPYYLISHRFHHLDQAFSKKSSKH